MVEFDLALQFLVLLRDWLLSNYPGEISAFLLVISLLHFFGYRTFHRGRG